MHLCFSSFHSLPTMNQLPPELIVQILNLCTLKSLQLFDSRKVAASATWKACAKRCRPNYVSVTFNDVAFKCEMEDKLNDRVDSIEYIQHTVFTAALFAGNPRSLDEFPTLPIANEGLQCWLCDYEICKFERFASYITQIVISNDYRFIDAERLSMFKNLRVFSFSKASKDEIRTVSVIIRMIQTFPKLEGFDGGCTVNIVELVCICRAISKHSKRPVTFTLSLKTSERPNRSLQFAKKHKLLISAKKIEEFIQINQFHTLHASALPLTYMTVRPNSVFEFEV